MPEANFRVYSLAAMCMRAELHILLHDSAYYVQYVSDMYS